MKLLPANPEAIRYACRMFHYSRSVPMVQAAFSVYNAANEWCGVICYSIGANNHIALPFGLMQGQVLELVRVALNGKQESTSKALAVSMRLIAKQKPWVKVLVSYADTAQGHKGIIYQATNWHLVGHTLQTQYVVLGKRLHGKTCSVKYGTAKIDELRKIDPSASLIREEPKLKYAYPLHAAFRGMLQKMASDYAAKHPRTDAQ